MRTLVLSDLHLGYAAMPGVFAGARALPALLDELARRPLRVILNGDTFDDAALGEPLESDPGRAGQQLRAIAEYPMNAPVFAALARVLERGGEVVLRAGEHDPEIGLEAVQAGLRAVLGAAGPTRMTFQAGHGPAVFAVGGVRVVVVHDLAAADGQAPPARALPRRLTHPLRRQFGMEFVDLFKPDAIAGALAALAVNPTAVKLLFAAEPAASVWRALADDLSGDPQLRELADAFGHSLGAHERELLTAALDPAGAIGCEPRDAWIFDQARHKLLDAALQRLPARQAPDGPPDEASWAAALALASECAAGAVLAGHTHVPCFRAEAALTFVGTGAWVWALAPPADDSARARLLAAWQRDPRVDPRRREPALSARFTAGLLEPRGDGASLRLLEWTDTGLREHAACELAPP